MGVETALNVAKYPMGRSAMVSVIQRLLPERYNIINSAGSLPELEEIIQEVKEEPAVALVQTYQKTVLTRGVVENILHVFPHVPIATFEVSGHIDGVSREFPVGFTLEELKDYLMSLHK